MFVRPYHHSPVLPYSLLAPANENRNLNCERSSLRVHSFICLPIVWNNRRRTLSSNDIRAVSHYPWNDLRLDRFAVWIECHVVWVLWPTSYFVGNEHYYRPFREPINIAYRANDRRISLNRPLRSLCNCRLHSVSSCIVRCMLNLWAFDWGKDIFTHSNRERRQVMRGCGWRTHHIISN